MNGVIDAIEKIGKRQKVDAFSTHVDEMLALLEAWRADADAGTACSLAELSAKLEPHCASVASGHKEMNNLCSKLGKAIDKAMPTPQQLEKALPALDLDGALVEQAVFTHLLATGQQDAAAELRAKGRLPEDVATSLVAPLREMHAILDALRDRDLAPAIEWVRANEAALYDRRSRLPFLLARLEYVQRLAAAKDAPPDAAPTRAALAYAREHLAPAARAAGARPAASASASASASAACGAPEAELRALVCALAFRGRLESSPYKALLSPELWTEAITTTTTTTTTTLTATAAADAAAAETRASTPRPSRTGARSGRGGGPRHTLIAPRAAASIARRRGRERASRAAQTVAGDAGGQVRRGVAGRAAAAGRGAAA